MTTMHDHDHAHEEDFIMETLIKAGFSPEEEDFEAMKEELEPLLMDMMMDKVFEVLTVEQRDEVMQLFDSGKEVEALEKIENLIPHYDEFLAGVFQQFQDEYLASIDEEE